MPRRSRVRLRRAKRAAALLLAVATVPLLPHTLGRHGSADGDLRKTVRAVAEGLVDEGRANLRAGISTAANLPFAMLGLSDRTELRYVTSPTARGRETGGLEVLVRWRLGGRWNEVALRDPAAPDSSRRDAGNGPSRDRRRAR